MEEPKWEKPKLTIISSADTSETVLWGSPGSDSDQSNTGGFQQG